MILPAVSRARPEQYEQGWDHVRVVRRSRRIRSLDRCRRPTRRLHPQHRCCFLPPRAHAPCRGGKPHLKHYGMTLADWQGASFVLSTATGKTEIVDNLSHLWAAAERLLSRPCDPLDEELIARLEGGLG